MRIGGRFPAVPVLVAVVSVAVGGVAVGQTTTTTLATTVAPSPSTTTPPTASPATSTTRPVPPTSPVSPLAPPADSSPADRVSTPTASEAAAARAAVANLTDPQRQLLRRLQSARDTVATARADALVLASRLERAQAQVTVADSAVQAAEARETAAASDLRRRLAAVKAFARALYRDLDPSLAFDAVNVTDRSTINRTLTYAKAPKANLDALVARARATKHHLEAARQRATAARAGVAANRDAVRAVSNRQQEALTTAERARDEAAAAASAALGSGVTLLAQVADPHFGPDTITATLVAAQEGENDPATLFGALDLPIADAPLGSPYGTRVDPLSGALGYHPGVDFEAPAGAEVHAAAAGTVVMAGDCGGYGNCVVVDHGRSTGTVSAHLSRTLVVVGQPVADGQVVGLVGSTGLSTGPHLHFEVRVHGVPVDPLAALME